MPRYTGAQIATLVRREKRERPCRSHLLVEGKDDRCIYSRFTSEEICKVRSCGGYVPLLDAISELDQSDFDGYLGVKDSDFDVISGKTRSEHVLTTDGHDLEIMLLKSSALESIIDDRIYNAFGQTNDNFKFAVRQKLFKCGSVIGYLRFVSEKCRWGIDINTEMFEKHVTTDCEIPLEVAARELKLVFPEIDVSQISVTEFEYLSSTFLEHLCVGDDLLYMLGVIFPLLAMEILGSRIGLSDRRWKLLKSKYSRVLFEMTALCEKLKIWEANNPCYQILTA